MVDLCNGNKLIMCEQPWSGYGSGSGQLSHACCSEHFNFIGSLPFLSTQNNLWPLSSFALKEVAALFLEKFAIYHKKTKSKSEVDT